MGTFLDRKTFAIVMDDGPEHSSSCGNPAPGIWHMCARCFGFSQLNGFTNVQYLRNNFVCLWSFISVSAKSHGFKQIASLEFGAKLCVVKCAYNIIFNVIALYLWVIYSQTQRLSASFDLLKILWKTMLEQTMTIAQMFLINIDVRFRLCYDL